MKLILAACLLGFAVAAPLPGEPTDGLMSVVAQIKLIIHTDYGYQQVKNYLLNLQSEDQVAVDVKAFVNGHTDEELKGVLLAFFSKVPFIAIEPIEGFKYPTLRQLFGEVKTVMTYDEGVAVARKYLAGLNVPNEIFQEVTASLLAMDDQELKHFFAVILSDIPAVYLAPAYTTQEELDEVVQQLKAMLTTSEGIQRVRDTLNAMQSKNPTMILIKTVLSAMSDKSLIDLVTELGKNIKNIELGEPHPDLLAVVTKGKNLLLTKEGLGFVRKYMDELQTNNFLLVRVRNFLKARSDEEIFESIRTGWEELFGKDAVLLYAPSDLRSLFVQIKHNLKSEYGYQALKKYLTNLNAKNIYVQIGKQYFLQMEDAQVREVAKEFLKNFHDIEIEEGFDYPTLAELFKQVKESILNDDGLRLLREYAAGLESDNLIVQKLQAALITVDDETLTDILVDLFQGV